MKQLIACEKIPKRRDVFASEDHDYKKDANMNDEAVRHR